MGKNNRNNPQPSENKLANFDLDFNLDEIQKFHSVSRNSDFPVYINLDCLEIFYDTLRLECVITVIKKVNTGCINADKPTLTVHDKIYLQKRVKFLIIPKRTLIKY